MRPAFICIASLMMAIVGCSPTNTLTSSFTLSAMLQGNWLVEIMNASKDWTKLGTLAIEGNSYHFDAAPNVEIPSSMQDRLCFFRQSAGEVRFEYESTVSPNKDVRTFENNDILLKVGIACGETFLIRADQDGKELYWHSEFSEVQLYRIHKSYSD